MTSIGSTGFDPVSAGRAMMNARISQAVSAGSISSTDQTAFATALDGIDSATSAAASSSSTATGSMKDRIDGLIDKQVSSGTLTDDQASELKSLFAQGPGGQAGGVQGQDSGSQDGSSQDGGSVSAMGGTSGRHHGMHVHGAPPPPPSDDNSDDSSDDSSSDPITSTASTGDTSSTSSTKQIDALISFLETLRASSSSSTYGTSSTATDSSNTGVLVNATA